MSNKNYMLMIQLVHNGYYPLLQPRNVISTIPRVNRQPLDRCVYWTGLRINKKLDTAHTLTIRNCMSFINNKRNLYIYIRNNMYYI